MTEAVAMATKVACVAMYLEYPDMITSAGGGGAMPGGGPGGVAMMAGSLATNKRAFTVLHNVLEELGSHTTRASAIRGRCSGRRSF